MNYNKCIVIGRLSADPEKKKMSNGNWMTAFSVATNKIWIDKEGVKHEDATYHNIVTFGKQAESCAQYLRKGQEVMIEGSINNRSWDKPDGTKGYRTEMIAAHVQFGRPVERKDASREAVSEPTVEYDKDDPKTSPGAKNGAKGGSKKNVVNGIEYPEEEIDPKDIPF